MASSSAIARVVVVHGLNSAPDRHWYPHLVDALADLPVTVDVPLMPRADQPEVEAWQLRLAEAIGPVDDRTLLVCHSLGCPAVLRYLSTLPPGWTLGALVTVAGFAEPISSRPALDPFTIGLDLDLVRRATHVRHSIASSDDPVVPRSTTDRLVTAIDSTLHVETEAGHFLDSNGIVELPIVECLVRATVTPVG